MGLILPGRNPGDERRLFAQAQQTSPNCCQGFDTSHNCGNSIRPKVECSTALAAAARHIQIVVTNLEMMMTWSTVVAVFVVVDLFGEQETRERREEEDGQSESKRRIFINGTVVNGIPIHPT